MEELCSARTPDEIVRISAALARRACGADGVWVLLSTGELYHHAPERPAETLSRALRSKVIAHISAWTMEAGQTAVVPDIHRDERTRAHTNESVFERSLVVVPVGGRVPFAAIGAAWAQEHWPSAGEVLLIETLARATGLALNVRLEQEPPLDNEDTSAVAEWLHRAADNEGLRGTERRQKLILAETRHRVRNVLSLVRSIVSRTAGTTLSAEDYAADLAGRISAIGRIQSFVMRERGGSVDLEELVNSVLIANRAHPAHVVPVGPPLRLKPRAAETLGLALHELSSNAVKFGALSTHDGQVAIRWTRTPDQDPPSVQLEWVESGVKVDADAPRRRGFGRELLERSVPYELRGTATLDFNADGAHCTIVIPLTADNAVVVTASAVD